MSIYQVLLISIVSLAVLAQTEIIKIDINSTVALLRYFDCIYRSNFAAINREL